MKNAALFLFILLSLNLAAFGECNIDLQICRLKLSARF
jgi:hypothetical protein